MLPYVPIKWVDGGVRMLDQRLLPHEVVYHHYTDYHQVAVAIQEMVIRGAPAIGLAAGYGMALAAANCQANDVSVFRSALVVAAETLRSARPTAANLNWAITRMLNRLDDPDLDSVEALRQAAVVEAKVIDAENERMDVLMGLNALPLIPDEAQIIHHCNTGALATGGYGSALGVVRAAHEHGKKIHVYVDETRPRLQGARLTAWELKQLGIPHTVIVDGASGHFMRTVGVDLCLVGCDRVAANGDTANKIGTYNLALVAQAHGVPFYVVGPTSTIDLATPTGAEIVIEDRPVDEMTHLHDHPITPTETAVANPAFDVTPAQYITAIITDRGIASPPFTESLLRLVAETA